VLRKIFYLGLVCGILGYCIGYYCVMTWLWDDAILLHMQMVGVLLLLMLGGIEVLSTITALDKYDSVYRGAIKNHLFGFCIYGIVGCLLILFANGTELYCTKFFEIDVVMYVFLKGAGALFLLNAFRHGLMKADVDKQNAQLRVLRSD